MVGSFGVKKSPFKRNLNKESAACGSDVGRCQRSYVRADGGIDVSGSPPTRLVAICPSARRSRICRSANICKSIPLGVIVRQHSCHHPWATQPELTRMHAYGFASSPEARRFEKDKKSGIPRHLNTSKLVGRASILALTTVPGFAD
jgi:hypothetical protein